MEIEERVKHYWTVRSHDFGAIRKNELEGDMGRRWLEELEQWLPKGKTLDILDVGTGTGFFAILLAGMGHRVTGIDLTPAMLEEGRAQAAQAGLSIDFRQMDAQEPDFPEGSFDVVLSRNLTWTLPDPEKAYGQWLRVLRRGGLLLNFDADYAANVRSESTQNCSVPPDSPYGHVGMTRELVEETVQSAERARLLRTCMAELHEDYREALFLVYFEGLSHAETAAVMGKREKQVADLIYRGKTALRKRLEQEGITDAYNG